MKRLLYTLCLTVFTCGQLLGADAPITVAVLNFASPDEAVKDLGPKVTTLMTAYLSGDPNVLTVERAELDTALSEQELGLSGIIHTDTAAKVGHLTGAKVLITGRVFRVDDELVITSKIISTETSRVYSEIVKGNRTSPITDLVENLGHKVSERVSQNKKTLATKPVAREDRVAILRQGLGEADLPTIHVKIPEVHFGTPTVDPAAETELSLILGQCGFELLDATANPQATVEIIGEAFSEFGLRRGGLVSCKARVEIKVRERASGKLLLVDRQTVVSVDLSEQIAAKNALAEAAAQLAERVIPIFRKKS